MRCFVLEDDPERVRRFTEWFHGKSIDWTCIHTCEQEYEFKPPYDYIFLDHDLGGRQMSDHEDSGSTFCDLIR